MTLHVNPPKSSSHLWTSSIPTTFITSKLEVYISVNCSCRRISWSFILFTLWLLMTVEALCLSNSGILFVREDLLPIILNRNLGCEFVNFSPSHFFRHCAGPNCPHAVYSWPKWLAHFLDEFKAAGLTSGCKWTLHLFSSFRSIETAGLYETLLALTSWR